MTASPGSEGSHPWIPGGGPLTLQHALIIVGGYRCGTTSLHAHLAGHPEINPSTIKEPAFFFSARLTDDPPIYPRGHEAEAYLAMFRKRSGRVLLESSATYLNDPASAARIARAMPNARVVIMMREPVARLVSWYRFRILQGWTSPRTPFEAWARAQLEDPRPAAERPYFQNALHHGLYAHYIPAFLRAFGRERVHFVSFDDMRRDVAATVRDVCCFAGITPDHFDRYEFPRQNEAMKIRRPLAFRVYRRLHGALFGALRAPFPRLTFRLREHFFGVVEPKLLGFFTGPADEVEMSPALREALVDYYRADLEPLREILGRPAPWNDAYARPMSATEEGLVT